MKTFVAISTAALLLAGLAPLAGAANIRCSGILAPGSYDNVRVTAGDCVIGAGITIRGNIDVESGASLFIHSGATVRGNISKRGPGSLGIFGIAVDGNVKSTEGSAFRLLNNRIRGNLELSNHRGLFNHPGFPPEIVANAVDGNLKVENNHGAAAVNISNNHIRGNLECKDNVPAPFGGGNVVKSKKHQCAGL